MSQTRRTEAELHNLKASWTEDPHWDIEDTDGFEAHVEELRSYRLQMERQWEEARKKRIRDRAHALGCPDNLALAEYVEKLESRLESQFESIWRGLEELRAGK